MRCSMLAVVIAVFGCLPNAPALAGDWLGGQYWGQISGCGHCGGSLYGLGYCGPCCDGASWGEPVPAPLPTPHANNESTRNDRLGIEDPQVPGLAVIPTAHTRNLELPSSRRISSDNSVRTYDDILPIAPGRGDVQTIRHQSQPQRLAPPPRDRIVAPNAWSGRLYR